MSDQGGIRVLVPLGMLVVVMAGAASHAWLAAAAPSRVASAAAPSVQPSLSPSATGSTGAPETAAPSPAAAYDQQRLDALAGLLPAGLASGCKAATPAKLSQTGVLPAPLEMAALAAVRCRQAGYTAVYAALPDLATTRSAFDSFVPDGSDPGSAGCWDGSPGVVAYSYGQVACSSDESGGSATIRWTYEPGNVIASVTGASGLRALVSWWWFRGLLQPAANAGGLTPEEEALVGLLPADLRDSCSHYDPLEDASAYNPVGSLGSVDCLPESAPIADVGFFQFTTADALAAWYDYRVDQADVAPGTGCLDGTPGETAWDHGRILCLVTAGGKAAIRWTDDRYQLYGALNATGKDLPSLVRWWRTQDLP